MVLRMSTHGETAWPEKHDSRKPRNRYALAGAAGLAAAVLTHGLVPGPAFPARAIVAASDPASAASASILNAAREAAVSKPVISRATASLIGTGFPAPPPGLAERIGVVAGWEGFHATSGEARLADEIEAIASASPAETPGTFALVAAAPDAERSARIATSLAQSLVAEREIAVAQARRQRESEAGERLGRLKAAASAARKRFLDLGGTETDPAQFRVATAAQLAAAQARVDILRAIAASGSPPLSDRRDISPSIDALQTSYLDLSRQLARAQETLGERHTTVISLHEEVRRASVALSAEWKRLCKLADNELAMARDRERAASRAEALANGRGALGDARLAMQLADDRVAHAEQAIRDVPDDERAYRLVAPAAVPTRMAGLPDWARIAVAILAGLLAVAVVLRLPRLLALAGRLRGRIGAAAYIAPAVVSATEAPSTRGPSVPVGAAIAAEGSRRRSRSLPPRRRSPDVDQLVARLAEIVPAAESVTTVVLAADEAGLDAAPDALRLARAAAADGQRVLLVEAHGDRPCLAAEVEDDAEPIVVDLFGELRVAIAEGGPDGGLWLAPILAKGARIAAGLAADPGTTLIDDLAGAFDLLIVDCGHASVGAAIGWGADAVIRVGARQSSRDDERFVDVLGLSNELLVGAFVSSRFVPQRQLESIEPSRAPSRAWQRPAERPHKARPTLPVRSSVVRSPATRRKVNGR